MRILTGSIILLLMQGVSLVSYAADQTLEVLSATGTTITASALSGADVSLARSLISPTAFRGSLGENVVSKTILKGVLYKTGNWQSITPRSGPQGFDHLLIKTNSKGFPVELMVGESKFNQSRLGNTLDGIQMGEKWIRRRLSALGRRYFSVAGESTFPIAKVPLQPKQQISVSLKNGQQVHFWRNSSLEQWKFSGRQEQLGESKRLAEVYGSFLKKAGSGAIVYRSRIFNIIPQGNNLDIVIYDAKNIDRLKNMKTLKQISSIKLRGVLDKWGAFRPAAEIDIARDLKTKLNLDDSGARDLARKITKRYNPNEMLSSRSMKQFWVEHGKISTGVALVTMVFDAALQFISTEHVDIVPLTISGASAGVGYAVHPVISLGLRKPVPYQAIRNISGALNCSPNMMIATVSTFAVGSITTGIFNYGLYLAGYVDLKTANRNMLIGTAANGAGILFANTMMAAAAAWGTAGTGSAIASLSGAAATNASLAWLGGGSLAAGGGGVALGSAVVTGGAILVAAAVAYGVYEWFHLKDESDDKKRILTLLELYSDHGNMDRVVENSLYVRKLRQE